MRKLINQAQPRLRFIRPRLNRAVLALGRFISTAYVRFRMGVRIEAVHGIERLIDEYRRYNSGRSKLIVVFRHVHVHDAPVIFHLINTARRIRFISISMAVR
jgi:hypothetical protein